MNSSTTVAINIYCRNYKKLLELIPTLLDIKTSAKQTAPGFMNLFVPDLVHRPNAVLDVC
jgi:hypothetical protein